MDTKVIATRIETGQAERLERVAKADRRSVSQVVALMVEDALPAWEAKTGQGMPPEKPKRPKT